jgi:hypothetical protein
MRAIHLSLTLAAVVLASAALPTWAQNRGTAARADVVDMDEKDRALVAKETLKQNRQQKSGKNGSNAGCGQVDIGNDSSSKKGSSQIADRQKTVIVTGNVINTANCK